MSYLGFALFGLAVISLGVFISSLSAHPLRAGLVTAICLIILWMTDSILPNVANPALHSAALRLFAVWAAGGVSIWLSAPLFHLIYAVLRGGLCPVYL